MEIQDIVKLIEKKRTKKYLGRKYYYFKPVQKKSIDYFIDGQVKTKEFTDNQEVYTNWFKVLVNQKIDYSLSKDVTINSNLPIEFNIDEMLNNVGLNSSIDSISWVQLYINKSNKLDWTIRNDSQIFAIFDEYKKYIEKIIYFWIDEKELIKKEDEQNISVQIWDTEKVIEFDLKNGKASNVVIKSHYFEVLKYRDIEEKINPKSFGFIPFIPLYNNKNKESDIDSIDILLECYNEINTGFINNIREFQEMVMKLVGYGGQDLDEFVKQLKKYKVIPVDENGNFDYVKVEIPVEARSVLLEIIRKNIFVLGRGVDPTDNFGGSNITNVLIKSKYANLDMKCSDFEKQIRIFYFQLINIINLYYRLNLDSEIKFNRTQIFNESEQIDNCLKSMGLVSNETILANHPFVTDVKKELSLISKENKEIKDMDNDSKHDKNVFDDNKNSSKDVK